MNDITNMKNKSQFKSIRSDEHEQPETGEETQTQSQSQSQSQSQLADQANMTQFNHNQSLKEHAELYEGHHPSDRGPNSIGSLIQNNKMLLVVIIVGIILLSLSIKHNRQLLNTPPSQTNASSLQQPAMDLQKDAVEAKTKQKQRQRIQKRTPQILRLTLSKEQLQQTIQIMKHPIDRPSQILGVKKSLAKQDQVYMAYSLSRQPNNHQFLQAEYYYYNAKYKIDLPSQELPICVVIVGRNLGQRYSKMLESVINQNYTNMHVVYIDDFSDDGTAKNIKTYIKGLGLSSIVTFIGQSQRKYALYNRNLAVRSYCQKEDIIIDVDADDWLIGKQVFKIVNALYQNDNLWACYFNNIIFSKTCHCPLMNSDSVVTEKMLEENTYRVSDIWRTTQLRTFRKQLFDKIQQSDFIDEDGSFYKWKSDAFMNFPIVQLAGPKHTRFLDQFVYFYDSSFSQPSDQKAFCRLTAKTQTPYEHLQSLEDEAKKKKGYSPPGELAKKLRELKQKIKK